VVYRVDDQDEVRASGDAAAALVEDGGSHTVSYYAVDEAGNRSATQSVHFKLDPAAPGRAVVNAETGWFSPPGGSYSVRIGAGSTPDSGIAGYVVTSDGTEPGATPNVGSDGEFSIDSLREGVTVIRARAVSGAGVASPEIGEDVLHVD